MTIPDLVGIGFALSLISCGFLIMCAFTRTLKIHFETMQSGDELLFFTAAWSITLFAASTPIWTYLFLK